MAFPTFVGHGGAVQESTTTLTVVNNASAATGDYELLVVETMDETVTLSTSGGFTHLADVSAASGTATVATRGTWFERIYSGQADPVLADAGNHVIATILTFRKSSGTWSTLADAHSATQGVGWQTSAEQTEDTTGSFPDIASAENIDYLLVGVTCHAKPDIAGGTAELSGITNGNLGSITERFDDAAASGNGGWIGAFTGQNTGGGAPGATTYTKATASYKAHIVIALRDAPPAGATLERSAAFDAAVAIASSGIFFTVFERAAAIDASLAVASAPQRALLRAAAIDAALGVASAPQRDLLRRAAIDAALGVASAPQRDLLRSAAIDAAVSIAASGAILQVFERSAAIGATVDIISAGTFFSILERAAALDAAVSIESNATFFSILERAAAIDAAVSVATSAEFFSVFERAAALDASIDVVSNAEFFSILERSAALDAAVTIISAGEVDAGAAEVFERSASFAVVLTVDAANSVSIEARGRRGWMTLFERPTGRLTVTGNDIDDNPNKRSAAGRAAREAKWDAREV